MQGKGDIENFLRKRLDNLENSFQDDWSVFEQKLEKALYLQRLRRMIWMGAFSLALLAAFVGVNMYQIWGGNLYEPRTEKISMNGFQDDEQAKNEAQTVSASSRSSSVSNSNAVPHVAASDQNTNISETARPTRVAANTTLPSAGTKYQLPLQGSLATTEEKTMTSKTSVMAMVPGKQDPGTDTPNENKLTLVAGSLLPATGQGGSIRTDQKETEFIDVDRLGLVLVTDVDERTRGGVRSNSEPPKLAYRVDDDRLGLNYTMPQMAPRPPIEAVKIETDHGPYVSPLQPVNPWSYSLNVYPNYNFRKFRADEDKFNMLHRDFIDAVQAAESGGFSLNVGFEVSKRIGDITYMNTGVEYISSTTEVAYNFTNFREATINDQGVITGYNLKEQTEQITFSGRNTYHYLNIPLSFSYQPWATDHVRLNIEMGGSFLYFVAAKGQTLNYKTLEIIDLSEREYRNYIGSLCFKVGANYYVSRRINVGFEPTIMYFTNTIYTEDYPFYVIPYSVGLNLNLQVKLN
ncbi:MAG: hypothetical protein CMI36_09750 [Owenweeksia sp.]|nr:hypothetical protein [Owenweeksia sp.]MBF99266.1 hypothetical protein [Owenweeksia sp.]